MKKIILVGIMFLMFMGVVSASSKNGDYKGNPIVNIYSGGFAIKPDDVPAMIYDGRTVVPISLLKKIGVEVTWDPSDYSVIVELPKQATKTETKTITIDSNADIKKQIKAIDLFIYLKDATKYISSLKGLMDNFYATETTKGNSKSDHDILYAEYGKTNDKLQDVLKKYNGMYLDVLSTDANEAFRIIESMKVLYKTLEDAYIDLTAWEMAKFQQGESSAVYNQSYASYSQKTLDSQSKALIMLSDLDRDYNNSVSNSLK